MELQQKNNPGIDSMFETKKIHDELRLANQTILNQQKAVIEEKRLRLLLKRIGIAAHDLGQPLMSLMGTITLMRMKKDDPQKLLQYLDRIDKAGQKITDILHTIQILRHDESKTFLNEKEFSIANPTREVRILTVEGPDQGFEAVVSLLAGKDLIKLSRANGINEAVRVLEHDRFDLILLDSLLADEDGFVFFNIMEKEEFEAPVVVLTRMGDEMTASRMIHSGAYEYLDTTNLNEETLSRAIANSLEKFLLRKEIKSNTEKMDA